MQMRDELIDLGGTSVFENEKGAQTEAEYNEMNNGKGIGIEILDLRYEVC